MTRKLLCVLCLLALSGAAWADWPQLQADASRSGYSPDAVRQPFKLKWAWYGDSTRYDGDPKPASATMRLGGLVQPVVADGQVFVGAMDGTLYAIDAEKGVTNWKFPTGRAIIHTVAYDKGVVVANSTDGCVYGVNAKTGQQVWKYETPLAIISAPAIADGVAYVTCRDGKALALKVADGAKLWEYDAGSPIFGSPAVGGGVLVFGSEDMKAHGVDISNGQRLWTIRLRGRSFRSSWPVVYKDMAIFHTMPSISGSEMQILWDPEMEAVLDAAPANDWPAERDMIATYLRDNPERRTVFVVNLKEGGEKYMPPIGYVAGNMQPPMPAVFDAKGRIYIYWRTRSSRIQGFGHYGSKWMPDISYMDPATGDRIKFPWPRPPQSNYFACELDNNFLLTLGGDVLYGANHFRVNLLMDLTDGNVWGISKPFKDERDGGYPVPPGTHSHYPVRGDQPPAPGGRTNGQSGVVPVGNVLYMNEPGASCVSAFVGTTAADKGGDK